MRTAPEGRDSRLRAELRGLRRAFKIRAQAVETVFQQPAMPGPLVRRQELAVRKCTLNQPRGSVQTLRTVRPARDAISAKPSNVYL